MLVLLFNIFVLSYIDMRVQVDFLEHMRCVGKFSIGLLTVHIYCAMFPF